MTQKTVDLEIITPSKLFYEGKVNIVIVRTLLGDEAFMAGHSWAFKLLDIDELWLQEEGSEEFKVAAVSGGFIDVKDTIIVYTDAAEWQDDIDIVRAEELKENAEELIADKEEHKADEIARAEVAMKKAVTRMRVAKGGRKRI